MTPEQQQGIARALLDALTALDPEDRAASRQAVPLAMSQLEGLIAGSEDKASTVAYGALTLVNVCVALVADVKEVDRLDVIAALRPLFAEEAGREAA